MSDDVLIFAVIATATVLVMTQMVRLWRASMLHRTIRDAISRDNPSLPALIDGIDDGQPARFNDDRTGLVLFALALALLLFGLIQGDADDIRTLGGAALFPGLVGAALLVRHYVLRSGR